MLRTLFVVGFCSIAALFVSGCGPSAECVFPADCSNAKPLCIDGRCVGLEPTTRDGGSNVGCQDGFSRVCYTGPAKTKDVGTCRAGQQVCSNGDWGECKDVIVPTKESCNGKDDDCNGTIDDDCKCKPGSKRKCYTGPKELQDKGICASGNSVCQSDGSWGSCEGSTLPTKESCNGKDDDCNGTIDDDCKCKPGIERECYAGPSGTAGKGPCVKGKQACSSAGVWEACKGQSLPKTETCNGKDDDCDGQIDNGLKAPACSKTQGLCKGAIQICQGAKGWKACTDSDYATHNKTYQATETTCDGLDNDCDGQTDEQLEQPCFSGKQGCTRTGSTYQCKGLCKAGLRTCTGGVWSSCTGEIASAREICNGKDDDCDGVIDNGNPQGGNNCSVLGQQGECAKGQERCTSGKVLCIQIRKPVKEHCSNRLDDDCNGKIDDCGVCTNGQRRACYALRSGCTKTGSTYTCLGGCRAGSQVCVNGQWSPVCTGVQGPKPELCNWIDDDCDGKMDEDAACVFSKWSSLSMPSGVVDLTFITPLIGVAVGSSGRIWRTKDGGQLWTSIPSGTSSSLHRVQAIYKGLVLAVGVGGVIVRSTDRGQTFRRVTSSTTQTLNDVSISQDGMTAVSVGNSGTIVLSRDGGQTWTSSSTSSSSTLYGVAIRSASASYMVAVGAAGRILRSTNRGSTWTQIASPTTQPLYAVRWNYNTVLAGGSRGTLLRSTSSGSTWTSVQGVGTADIRSIRAASRSVFSVAASNFRTFYVSMDDGVSFVPKTLSGSSTYQKLAYRSPTAIIAFSSARAQVGEGPIQYRAKQISFSARSAAFAQSSSSKLAFVVGQYGIVYRSLDRGLTWEPLFIPTTGTLNSVAHYGNIVLVVGTSGMIFRSADQGATWTSIKTGQSSTLYGVSMHQTTALAVGSSRTLLRSTNGGTTWTKLTPPNPPFTSSSLYAVSLQSSRAVAVGSSGWIVQSTNSGTSWTRVGSGVTTSTLRGVQLYDNTTDAVVVGSAGVTLYSSNGGTSWSVRSTGSRSFLYSVGIDFKNAVSVGTAGTILLSRNQGSTWSQASSPTSSTLYGVFRNYAQSNYIAAGSNSTLLTSTDYGVNWSLSTFSYSFLRKVIPLSSQSFVTVGTGSMIAKTTDNAKTWTFPLSKVNQSLYGAARSTSGTLVAVGYRGAIIRSTNSGVTWSTVNSTSTTTLYDIASPSSRTFMAVGSSGLILRSTNDGASFSAIRTISIPTLQGIACASNICLAVGSSGTIVRSTNSGLSFAKVTSNTSTSLYGVTMGSSARAVAVGAGGKLFYTENGGVSWKSASSPVTTNVYGVSALNSMRYLASDYNGRIIASGDGGKTWSVFSPDLGATIYGFGLSGGRGLLVGAQSLRALYIP